MRHETLDEISLTIGRRVAERLAREPELLEIARANLARWSRRDADSPGLLSCYGEWREILDRKWGRSNVLSYFAFCPRDISIDAVSRIPSLAQSLRPLPKRVALAPWNKRMGRHFPSDSGYSTDKLRIP